MSLSTFRYIVSLSFLPFILNNTYDVDMFYCIDWDCQDYISRGRTLLNYAGKTERHLSFRQNEEIKILGKPVDVNGPDWVGSVRKKIGLVPKSMVREDQMGKHSSQFKYPLNLLPVWNLEVPHETPKGSDDNNLEQDTEYDESSENDTEQALEANTVEALMAETKLGTPPPDSDSVDSNKSESATEGNIIDNTTESKVSETFTVSEKVGETVVPETLPESEKSEKETNSEKLDNATESDAEILLKNSEVETKVETSTESSKLENAIKIEASTESPKSEDAATYSEKIETTLPDTTESKLELQSDNTMEMKKLEPPIKITESENEIKPEALELKENKDSSEPELNNSVDASESKNLEEKTVLEMLPTAGSETLDGETSSKLEFNQANDVIITKVESEATTTELPTTTTMEYSYSSESSTTTTEAPATTTETVSLSPETVTESSTTNSPEVTTESPQIVEKSPEVITESPEIVAQLPEVTTEFPEVTSESPTTESPEVVTELPSVTEDATTKLSSTTESELHVPTTESPVAEPSFFSFFQSEPNPVVVPQNSDLPSASNELNNEVDDNLLKPTTEASIDLNKLEDTDKVQKSEYSYSQSSELLKQTDNQEDNNIISDLKNSSEESDVKANDEPITPIPELNVESVPENPAEEATTLPTMSDGDTTENIIETSQAQEEVQQDLRNDEHTHDHHHHHHHEKSKDADMESSSFILVVKHLSSTLLSFLPEHLQDTVLDVDDALVFTGIIALTLVSICVPYFLIEGFFSVRPLKKKVTELNKSLWKVSTAYENQQEEFEIYKKKALAYDEDKKRVEQLEYELVLLKKLEGKQKEQVTKYQKELKTHKELTSDMQSFLDKEAEKKKKILEEKEKLKTTVTSLKEALRRTTDELQDAQLEASTAIMDLELARQSNETFNMKAEILEREVGELKAKLLAEVDRRRGAEDERDEILRSKEALENEYGELKKICHKYEETVSDLNTEISHKENELSALKETLGDDSPLVDIAEVKAKLVNAEEEATSLHSRVEAMTLENSSLSRNLKEATSSLSSIQKEKDEALNRLQVLEAWFKEKEEELRKAVERYESERNIRGKDKDELVRLIEEKSDENKQLSERMEAFREEFEETKTQHRNEIRALEAKSHESWLSLCQAERKAHDARKEAELLRQTLTALTKEKAEQEGEEMNGELPMFPLITPDMVPLPLPDDDVPSYFGLGDGFMPPPPLPLDGEREPHRPAPLGRLSPNYSDLDDALSPIRRGNRRHDDYSNEESSASDDDSPRHRRSPRGGWDNRDMHHHDNRDRDRDHRRTDRRRGPGPRTSSPVPQAFNL